MGFAAAKAEFKFRSIMTRSRMDRDALRKKVIVAVALVAFAIQSFVVQTHIHFAGNPDFGFSATTQLADANDKAGSKGLTDHRQNSPSQDPAHCPICQEFLHAGQFVIPAPFAGLLLTVVVVPITIATDVPIFKSAFSHSWRGRAPPRI